MSRLRLPALLAVAGGLALGLWAIGRAGAGSILLAIGRMGWGGFALYLAATLPMVAALGAAWASAVRPGVPRPIGRFAWARMLREAANELLPFSQLGGLVVGTRALITAGLPAPRVYAATIVDLTTEMAAQIAVTLAGLWAAGTLAAGSGMAGAAWIGAGALLLLTLATALLQRPVLRAAAALAGRLLPRAAAPIDAVRRELTLFGLARGATVAPFLWNLAAWLLAIAASWLALRLLGADIGWRRALAMEAFIFALRSGAFFVPAAIGVQEVGYLLVAHRFGLDRDVALALSLVKRAREIAFGLPALLVWQAREIAAARREPARAGAG